MLGGFFMDFLYRNIHMEQKKWSAASQMTIEEDINVPDAKGDCLSILLKDAALHIDETRSGREQVVVKGNLEYQILYETKEGGRLEELTGNISFEEVINANGAVPGEVVCAKGVIEDFKVSMINTRKIAIQSVVMLHAYMHQLMEEEWTDDIVNCEMEVEKRFGTQEVMQLCQKKSDVFRVKEEIEIPGSYPVMQSLLWKSISIGELEVRPMDGKVSLKGELNCYFIYMAQGSARAIKMFSKKVPFHGLIECSGCESDRQVSVLPVLSQYTAEIKADSDGEERVLFLEAVLDLQIRIYDEEKAALLQDMYGIGQELEVEEKQVHAPALYVMGEGKCKLKQNHKLKDAAPKAVQILHSYGTVFRDAEQWEEDHLHLMGSVLFQVLYLTGDEEMPYAVAECIVPYTLEMEGMQNAQHPIVLVEPRMEQAEASLIDSQEMEIKGIVTFSVLVFDTKSYTCVGGVTARPLDTAKFAALPAMVVCFADKETPLWDYGKRYYMPMQEIKKLNNLTEDTLKAGESMLLVKGTKK